MAAMLLTAQPAAAAKKGMTKKQKLMCGFEDRDSLRIGGFSTYPPFVWEIPDPKLVGKVTKPPVIYHGFIADLLNDILVEIGVKYKTDVLFSSAEDMREKVMHNGVDLIFTAYYEGDSSGYDYIFPAYFGNPVMIISPADRRVETVDPAKFSGRRAVVWQGENLAQLLRGGLPTDTKLDETPTMEKAFDMILSGEADFMFGSPYIVRAEAKRLKVFKKIYMHKEVFRSVKLFMAFSKFSQCRFLKEPLKKALQKKFEDKEYIRKKLFDYVDEWAGPDAKEPDDDENEREEEAAAPSVPSPEPAAAPSPAPEPPPAPAAEKTEPARPPVARPPVVSGTAVKWGRRPAGR